MLDTTAEQKDHAKENMALYMEAVEIQNAQKRELPLEYVDSIEFLMCELKAEYDEKR